MDEQLKERIGSRQAARDRAKTALERARSGAQSIFRISPHVIERFAETMRHNLGNGETNFRKTYVRSIVDRIEVDNAEIRMKGRKNPLEEEAVIASSGSQNAVRGSVRGWWSQ